MRRTTRWLAVLAAMASASCLDVIPKSQSKSEIEAGHPGFDNTVQVKFLGVGGFSVRLGHHVFVTAPHYSTPFVSDVLPPEKPIPPCLERIGRFHQPTVAPADIRAILVGHAHYDHLMDVAPIWQGLPQQPPIYGSATMRNILTGYGPALEKATVVLDDEADYTQSTEPQPCEGCLPSVVCPTHPPVSGMWSPVPGDRIRLMALGAAHPAQFAGELHWPGCVTSPRTRPPEYSCDFREGQVFSYLVDFLDAAGKPVFRTYYQDTPAHATKGWGLIPKNLLVDKKVDLMLLCGGNWNVFERSEEVARATGVRFVVLGHWEDFFVPQDLPIHEIPGMKVGKYVKRLAKVTGVKILVPEPQVMMHFPVS